MAETVYKSAKRKGFTVIYRSVAQDKRLSLKARGLFLLLQSLPEDWSFTQRGIAAVAGVGRDQIRSALKELEAAGYLVTEQTHDEAGKFSGAVVTLREEAEFYPVEPETAEPESAEPCPDAPLSGNPTPGNPSPENPTLQNHKENNNNKHTPHTPQGGRSAPKWKPERFERFWTFYRSFAAGKQGPRLKAVRAWDRLKPSDILIDRMARVLSAQADSDMWRRGIGIPYAASWLNGRRWEDEIIPDGARLADGAVLPCALPVLADGADDDPERGRFL